MTSRRKETDMLNRLVLTAVLGLLALAAAPQLAHATATPPVYTDTHANPQVLPAFAQTLDFIGETSYRMEASTPNAVAVLLVTGSGMLYDVADDSGTAGDYCIFFDSNTTAGIGLGTTAKRISPGVLTSPSSTGCTSQGICGQWVPGKPHRFETGLVGIKYGTGNNNCLAGARLDAGTNPQP